MILRRAFLLSLLCLTSACGDALNETSKANPVKTAPALSESELDALNQEMFAFYDAVSLPFYSESSRESIDQSQVDYRHVTGGTTKHGTRFIFTHVNRVALNALLDKEYPLPDGSLIIMGATRSTNKNNPLIDGYYVMKKVKGYNPETNDWYFTGAGNRAETKHAKGWEQACINCHKKSETDFLYAAANKFMLDEIE